MGVETMVHVALLGSLPVPSSRRRVGYGAIPMAGTIRGFDGDRNREGSLRWLHTRAMTAASRQASVIDVGEALLELLPGAVDGWKLQKLCYLVQGKHLAEAGTPAFRENIEAWTHGPVIDRLYQAHMRRRFVETVRGDAQNARSDEVVARVIAQVAEEFGGWSPRQLRALTRAQYPWIEARYGLGPADPSRREMSLDTMREYFELIGRLPDDDLEDGGAGPEAWAGVLQF